MYEIFEKMLKEKGVKVADVCKATGLKQSMMSDWKKGRYTPKADKLQLIADYFDVPLETFTGKKKKITAVFHNVNKMSDSPAKAPDADETPDLFQMNPMDFVSTLPKPSFKEILKAVENSIPEGYPVYYTDPETAQIAQEVFDNPDLRMLFSAARDAKPEDIKLAADMLRRFKETNPDG